MADINLSYNLTEEKSVIRGTFYGSLGVVFRIVFLFAVNLFLARFFGAEDYGIWSINFIILAFFNTFVLLGLERGIARFIGKYRGSEEGEKIAAVINDSVILVFFASILSSVFLYFSADFIANFFNISGLALILKITAFSFIPSAMMEIVGAIFQGHENIKISRFINSFIPSFLFFAAVLVLFFTDGINLYYVSLFYTFSAWIGGLVSLCFFCRYLRIRKISISLGAIISSGRGMKKLLLAFSLPLLLFNLISNVGIYSDSLIIGYLLGAYKVGIYNVAFRIARLSPFLLLGSLDVFTPLVSKNIHKKENSGFALSEVYCRSTKWLFAGTLLVIIAIMVFPRFFIGWFGNEFIEGSFALRLLLISYLIYAFAGPADAINIAFGDTKFVAFYSIFSAAAGIILCFALIPVYGIEGAAAASIISVSLSKIIALYKLKVKNNVNIFTRGYLNFAFFSVFSGLIIGFLVRNYISSGIIGVIFFAIAFAGAEFCILKKLNLIDKKDLILRDSIISKIMRIFAINYSK